MKEINKDRVTEIDRATCRSLRPAFGLSASDRFGFGLEVKSKMYKKDYVEREKLPLSRCLLPT